MKNENKLKYEKYIMNISLIGSVLFMIAEGVMAFWTRSHSILMDCIFDLTRSDHDRSVFITGAIAV